MEKLLRLKSKLSPVQVGNTANLGTEIAFELTKEKHVALAMQMLDTTRSYLEKTGLTPNLNLKLISCLSRIWNSPTTNLPSDKEVVSLVSDFKRTAQKAIRNPDDLDTLAICSIHVSNLLLRAKREADAQSVQLQLWDALMKTADISLERKLELLNTRVRVCQDARNPNLKELKMLENKFLEIVELDDKRQIIPDEMEEGAANMKAFLSRSLGKSEADRFAESLAEIRSQRPNTASN